MGLGLYPATAALRGDLSLPASERGTEEVTWEQCNRHSHMSPNNELGNNQAGECTSNAPVPLCHGVYPMTRAGQHADVLLGGKGKTLTQW